MIREDRSMPPLNLSGVDGNAFALLGEAKKAAR
jgi:hypothetical protein